MNPRHLPNAITGLRLALAPLLLWLLWARQFEWALGVALVAGASDLLDGFLAKRFGWQSRLGSLLDPIADKTMMGLAVLGLWLVAMLPGWLVGLVLVRDLVIVAGALAWWKVGGPFDGKPTVLGKLCTLAQLGLVLLCLVELAGWLLPLQARKEAIIAAALLTLTSGVDYVVRYGARAWLTKRNTSA